jgi:DNA (cytosine-5)-methyltransferase 3A
MSCGQQALERTGIKVDNYCASEIDKYAIQVTMANYPNTIQLGSVVGVDGYSLPKIDLLIGGSPCQSFSFAGKRKGMSTKCETEILTLKHYLELKAEGYEFEGQSYLFWEFMRLLYECKPKYFLLENVEMGEKWEKVLSKAIGVNGIHINSALVSAQNRKRIYWTNIGLEPAGLFGYPMSIIRKPKDKKILLKDILETEVDEKYFLSEKMLNYLETNSEKQKINKNGFNYLPTDGNKKGKAVTTKEGSRMDDNFIIQNIVLTSKDKRLQKIVDNNIFTNGEVAHLDTYNQTIDKDKSPALKLPHNDRFIIAPTGSTNAIEDRIYDIDGISPALNTDGRSHAVEVKALNENQEKKFNPNINSDKANALTLAQGRAGSSSEYMDSISKIANITSRIRRLTPTECERLQTVKDGYTAHVSDSQRYKMLGNGWTVDVIAYIFSYLD